MTDIRVRAATTEGGTLSIGRVFNRAFASIGGDPVTIFGIAFVFGAFPTALLKLAFQDPVVLHPLTFGGSATGAALGLAALIFGFVLFAQAALIHTFVMKIDGRSIGFGQAAFVGVRKIMPLFVLEMVLGIAIVLGLIVLLVPGIILWIMWSAAPQILIEEKVGILAAIGRSAFLTRGARWNVLGVHLVTLLSYYLVSSIGVAIIFLLFGTREPIAAASTGPAILFVLISSVTSTLALTLVWAIQTSLYVELRDWKDGPATDRLDAIFA